MGPLAFAWAGGRGVRCGCGCIFEPWQCSCHGWLSREAKQWREWCKTRGEVKTLSIREFEVLVFPPLAGSQWGVSRLSLREVLLRTVP